MDREIFNLLAECTEIMRNNEEGEKIMASKIKDILLDNLQSRKFQCTSVSIVDGVANYTIEQIGIGTDNR